MTEGQEVTLQCQRPAAELGPVMFALLKAGSAAPVQVRAPAGRAGDRLLPAELERRRQRELQLRVLPGQGPFPGFTGQSSP